MKRQSLGDTAIDAFGYLFLTLLGMITLFPFLNVVSKSVSEEWAVTSGAVGMLPIGFQLDTLKYVVTSGQFLNSFIISVFVTLVGTISALACTVLAAYPLSKHSLPGMKIIMVMFVFTMMFSGGIIPTYILMNNLGLVNNLAALILPSMISVYNMLVMKSYMETLPSSLEESAYLDGANDFIILFKIIIPLSKPVLATISLFYAVAHWNDFFAPMLYISKPALKTLQLYLRDIVLESDASLIGTGDLSIDQALNLSTEGVKAATIIASTVPIILVYPFLQKYFIKGILIGSVKG